MTDEPCVRTDNDLEPLWKNAGLTLRDKYWAVWDSINASRGYPWESNPWVWKIEFKFFDWNGGYKRA
jgi:hypothetical protein